MYVPPRIDRERVHSEHTYTHRASHVDERHRAASRPGISESWDFGVQGVGIFLELSDSVFRLFGFKRYRALQ